MLIQNHFKKHKLLKICDILKLLKPTINIKTVNYHTICNLPFQPNANTHDHATCIQHKIHQIMSNHVFAKNYMF